MKTLLISQRVDVYPDRNERRDAVDQALIKFVSQAGYLPVPVPNSLVDTSTLDPGTERIQLGTLIGSRSGKLLEEFLDRANPDGIVLSGGNDVGSCLDRDVTEAILIGFAIKKQIPLLGICRGMQMLGVFMGSELQEIQNHVRTRHILNGVYSHEVNSYHDFCLTDVPDKFQIEAKTDDGVIEAIVHISYPLYGWMWHPERETPLNSIDLNNFRKIFE